MFVVVCFLTYLFFFFFFISMVFWIFHVICRFTYYPLKTSFQTFFRSFLSSASLSFFQQLFSKSLFFSDSFMFGWLLLFSNVFDSVSIHLISSHLLEPPTDQGMKQTRIGFLSRFIFYHRNSRRSSFHRYHPILAALLKIRFRKKRRTT